MAKFISISVQPRKDIHDHMPGLIKKYVLLTKPGIVGGNLIAAGGGFLLASGGLLAIEAILPVIIGISLVVASGCVFNNYLDRHIDRKMARTCNRVLARGLITPKASLCYGSILGIIGLAMLLATTNIICLAIVLGGFAIYVGAYTLYLKRYSLHATLIGSLAGAAPPLAGYTAVTGCLDLGALLLLCIFTLWQIPHSYAIAIFRLDDYRAATIPVLPLRLGITVAKKHILLYIAAFTGAAMMLSFCGYTGYGYLTAASLLGMCWLVMAWNGWRSSDNRLWARRLFVFSIVSIMVLSIMMSLDSTMPLTSGKTGLRIAEIFRGVDSLAF